MDFNCKGNRARIPTSYKTIKLTSHSIQRAEERLNLTRKEDIKKLASAAKNSGIHLSGIRRDTYEKLGLTFEEYCYLKSNFNFRTNSTGIYVYKGAVFIFVGKSKSILKTIINLKLNKKGELK